MSRRAPLRPALRRAVAAVAIAATGCALAQELATFLDTVEVRIVNVDVVVLDAKGEAVVGLARDEFELFEEGRAVEITNFAAYEDSAGKPPSDGLAAAPAAADEPPRAAPAATWVVYVDQHRIRPGTRNLVLRQARRFLAESVRPEDRSFVATFDGRALRLLSTSSSDLAPALAALDELEKSTGAPPSGRASIPRLQADLLQADPSSPTAAMEGESILADLEAAAEEEAASTRAASSAFSDLISILSGADGRVALLFVGGGFAASPLENLYDLWERKFGAVVISRRASTRGLDPRLGEARTDAARRLEEVNSSRITIYSIDAGDSRAPGVGADTGGTPWSSGPALGSSSDGEESSTLTAIAVETGGRMFRASEGLAGRLEAARRDLRSYYSLGYSPTGSAARALRELEVRVKRAGVRVIHRRGVRELSAREEAGQASLAAVLGEAQPPNQLGIALEVGAERKGARRRQAIVPLTVTIPLRGAALIPDGAAHRALFEVFFTVRDPDGGFRRMESREMPVSIPNDRLAAAMRQVVALEIEFPLARGRHRIGVSAVDRVGGLRGAAAVEVEVLAP